jgi:LysM repeat protein
MLASDQGLCYHARCQAACHVIRGRTVHMYSRRISGLLIIAMLFVACTRNRPEPEATATLQSPDVPVAATKSGTEPDVTIMTPTTDTTGAAMTSTPAVAAADQSVQIPTQAVPEALATAVTIDYIVKAGETLTVIAAQFGTDVDTLRRLNYLVDDNVFSGQILHIPNQASANQQAGSSTAGSNSGTGTISTDSYHYTVQAGDTLGAIAQRFGVNTVKIIAANNLTNPDNLLAGSKLIIPDYQPSETAGSTSETDNTSNATSSTSGGGVEHIVQPGEGLIQIAEKYGVDAGVLAEANGLTNRNLLRVGQKLIIPGVTAKEAAQARGKVHVVQSGESLAGIAVQYGVTVDEMVKLNGLANPDAIFVGQELIVPGQ